VNIHTNKSNGGNTVAPPRTAIHVLPVVAATFLILALCSGCVSLTATLDRGGLTFGVSTDNEAIGNAIGGLINNDD
jgi:hypothetical protein